jgi:hypothetical protein
MNRSLKFANIEFVIFRICRCVALAVQRFRRCRVHDRKTAVVRTHVEFTSQRVRLLYVTTCSMLYVTRETQSFVNTQNAARKAY